MSDTAPRRVPGWVDPLLVAVWTVVFVAWTRHLPFQDWPLGDGWNRYLGNAIAIAEHDPGAYLPWRGPGHAWLCLAVLPLAGTLVRASQAIALVSTAALFPLTWGLGRVLSDRGTALLGVVLLAAWPDLRLFGWYSSPYALEGALVTGGALAGVAAVAVARRGAAVGAGVGAVLAFGWAVAVDQRGGAFAAAVGIGLGLAAAGRGGRAWIAVGALVLGVVGIAATLSTFSPVVLYSLAEQVALQRDHVAPLSPACVARGAAPPTFGDLVGPCGQALLRWNIEGAVAALPLSPWLFAGLAAVGALPRGRPDRWRVAVLVLPIATLVPSVLVVALQHRYLVPVAPFAAVLVARGLAGLADAVGRRWPRVPARVGAAGLALTFAVGWQVGGPSLLTRTGTTPRGSGATASLAHRGAVVVAADLIRAGHAPGDRVIDCANANLRERLYPIPVEPMTRRGGAPRACAGFAGRATPRTWLFLRGGAASVDPGWTELVPASGPGAPVLLHRP